MKDPTDLEGRRETAAGCRADLKFDFPAAVDGMKDEVAVRWSAWPERLFVVSKDGTVVYTGDQGPMGFNPGAGYKGYRDKLLGVSLEDFLRAYLAD